MKASDPWLSLRAGKVTEGLKEFKRNYAKEPTPSHIMELGVAYLWLRRYEEAWELFAKSLEESPGSMSSFYGMAGAAQWCLGNIGEAVRQWRAGLKSNFADTNGLGIHLPLLLFVTSLLRPGSFEQSLAVRILKEKARDPRVKEWPGPIALCVIGEIGASELWNRCSGGDAVETHDRRWLASFYEGALTYAVGTHADFRNRMQRLADTSDPQWANQDFFLARMWSEEFFLARHEGA